MSLHRAKDRRVDKPCATMPAMAQQRGKDTCEQAILARVRAIPCGWVRTYGDISPGAPRVAGWVLSHTDACEVPWHRVVRADGSLAKGERQRRLLEAEGVPFNGARVMMSKVRLHYPEAG
jgi:methylated-DNA-protein-cysteine methyltransferase-like protein